MRWLSAFVGIETDTGDPFPVAPPDLSSDEGGVRWQGYIRALLVCAGATVLARLLRDSLAPANLILLYLISVAGVAVRLGQRPAILASVLSVLAFDFFLVPPYHSFTVEDTQYLLTFAIMLAVALIISTMTASLRHLARVAHYRERRASVLFDLTKELSAALTLEQIIDIAKRHLKGLFQAEVTLYFPDNKGEIESDGADDISPAFFTLISRDRVRETYDLGATDELPELRGEPLGSQRVFYVPLRAPMRNRGVLTIIPEDRRQLAYPEQQRLLQTCAAQIALAIERVHYVEVAYAAEVTMKAEQLRNSLLSALSHDVRTPLTAIVGLSSTLVSNTHRSGKQLQELADAIQEEALRMNGLVTNLLEMAKLQADGVRLNRHWQFLEEVIGSSLSLMGRVLQTRTVDLALAKDLPLLDFDAVLIERVLCNLLGNVAKYTPAGSPCRIAAHLAGDEVEIEVVDAGPGVPKGMEEAIFEKFTRGETESSRSGIGLGLSICRAIVEAHGGRIWAENLRTGGARFVFTLPVGTPPVDKELQLKTDAAGELV